ncbi:MAG: phage Gp37/Gp68 family protein [Nitratireductor sp.]|nr:phage Gp37/Gp68 family protein [Nitratireductor sp.]
MSDNTPIEWARHTFNPWIGCTKISPACDHCYAEEMMDTRYGRVEWGAPGKGAGTRVRTSAANWKKPLAWDRAARKAGDHPFVFCSSLADVFDNQVNPAWRYDLFDLIEGTPNLIWLLLTKRPQNIVEQFCDLYCLDPEEAGRRWPRNAAIGTTVEDQTRADLNIPHLLNAKSELNPAFAFLSCEPMLGPIDLEPWLPWPDDVEYRDRTWGCPGCEDSFHGGGGCKCPQEKAFYMAHERVTIDWVIAGGESGPHARPMHPDWARALRDECMAAGVPFLFKQWGEYLPVGQTLPGCGKVHGATAVKPDRMKLHYGGTRQAPPQYAFADTGVPVEALDDGSLTFRVGKKRSGRLLDGIEHNAMPEVRA